MYERQMGTIYTHTDQKRASEREQMRAIEKYGERQHLKRIRHSCVCLIELQHIYDIINICKVKQKKRKRGERASEREEERSALFHFSAKLEICNYVVCSKLNLNG